MAMIYCPECGKQVSDQAVACPNCGYPIAARFAQPLHTERKSEEVRIKLPNTNQFASGFVGLFCSKNACIKSAGRTIWQGHHGDTARFRIDEPKHIMIDLGNWANPVTGDVEPGRRYQLVQDQGVHMLATFRLSEVDIIDSDK